MNKKIIFKTFNLDLNEHELIRPYHVPTLYLFLNDKKNIVQITDVKNFESLQK